MTNNLKKIALSLDVDVEKALVIPDDIQKLLDLQSSAAPTGDIEMYPEDFLEEAEQFFETGDQNARMDVMVNVRQAVRRQMDEWMTGLAFPVDLPFKKKLDILKDLGFAPRILRRLSEAGLLLGERETPLGSEVENALDLAHLFVLMSRGAILPLKLLVGNEKNLDRDGNYYRFHSGLEFTFKPAEKCCGVVAYNKLPDEMGHIAPEAVIAEFVYPIADPLYLPIVRLVLAVGSANKTKEKKALQALWDHLS
jgi:hypothetical protein